MGKRKDNNNKNSTQNLHNFFQNLLRCQVVLSINKKEKKKFIGRGVKYVKQSQTMVKINEETKLDLLSTLQHINKKQQISSVCSTVLQ